MLKETSDTDIKAIELIRKLTEIPSFKMTSNNEAVLTLDKGILPRLQKIFTDLSESSADIKSLITHLSDRPDPEDKELRQFIIPDIRTHYLTLRKIEPMIPSILSKKFDNYIKRGVIIMRLIQELVDKAIAAHKRQSTSEMNGIITRLDSIVENGFNLISDILFCIGLNLEQKRISKELFNNFVSWIRPEFFKEILNLDNESVINNYFSHIFLHLINMRRTNYLLKKYLKFSNYLEISKLILEQACLVYFDMVNNGFFENLVGNVILLEYREVIDEITLDESARRKTLLKFHELLFFYSIKNVKPPETLFHYRFLTRNKNIKYLSSCVKTEECFRADKFFISVGFGSLAMWNRLLKMNEFSHGEIFSEAKKFLLHLNRYIARRHNLNIFSETAAFVENNSHFESLLTHYKEFLAQETKPDYKKISPQRSTKPDEKSLILAGPERPQNSLLPPPPPLPTLHKSQDECDADKQLKAKKYREALKKEYKKQQTSAPQSAPREKVYEISSRLGHLIYGALCLPPKTSPAIIETATRILEKGRLGVKNNQVKFVSNEEIKKMGLPNNAHYKLKGEIIRGEEKGQLMRIYGIPNPENIVIFSVLVHKPHKSDGIEKIKPGAHG